MSTNTDAPESGGPRKERHGCLAAWLWWLVIGNAIAAVASPMMLATIRQRSIPDFPAWVAWPFSLLSVLGVLFAVALLRWKKWGFYGYAATAVGIFALNVYAGVGVGAAALGLVGTAILFGVLQVGGPKNGCSQLE
jgi:hypothetical protein